jgi:hypothetical protein
VGRDMEVTIGCVHGDENGHKAHKKEYPRQTERRGLVFCELEGVWSYIAVVVCGDMFGG